MSGIPLGKNMLPIYVDTSVSREIKIYAAETGKTMREIMQPFFDDFEQSCIKLVAQIKEMRREAELKRIKEEEEARLAAENPLLVTGQPEPVIAEQIAQ